MKILHYNVNPNQRPTNAKLSWESFMNCSVTASIGSMWVTIPLLVTSDPDPAMFYAIPVSAAIALILFLPYLFHRGFRKRKNFVSAGGDSTGMSLWMFGSMGGKLLTDGTWQWKKLPPVREEYYLSESDSLKIKESKAKRAPPT